MKLTIDQALSQAVDAHKTGKLQKAERLYRAILKVQPKHPDANHNLGVLAVRVGKPLEALPYLKTALETNANHGQFRISYINALIKAEQIAEAGKVLEEGRKVGLAGEAVKALEQKLNEFAPKSNQNSTQAQKSRSKSRAGKAKAEHGSLSQPQFPSQQQVDELLTSYNTGNFQLAENQATALMRKYPNHPFGWKVLGAVFRTIGRVEESLEPMRQSLRLNPHDAEAHRNLGLTLNDLGHLTEAETSFREAVRLNPDYAIAHSNLGNALKNLGRLTEAEASYREAIRLNPDYAEVHSNLGNALNELGRLTEAEASFREAIRLKPDYAIAHSTLLFSLNYAESLPVEEALNEAKRYGSLISTGSQPKFTSWLNEPDLPRLRIGFVSGDLRNHSVGYFVEGLIKGLDQSQFEIYAFPTTPMTDNLTKRIRPYFRDWTPIYGKTDFAAASAIHERGIQVLFDLSGHTAHNRLQVFSYKPAPVQVSWLGYFATTGLPEMDFVLGDPHLSPQSERHHFTEKVCNLAETWLCLTPPSQPIQISTLPALTNGYMTFGCFGNLSKMNDQVVRTWSYVLHRVPSSKLFLKSKQLADPKVIDDVHRRFISQDISADRLILEGRSSRTTYFEAHNRIDMILDTFPYPGGTTSVNALWMGVPVLTLKGDRFLSHLGESIAINAGQTNWIAQDTNDYISKAAGFASDLQSLAALRGNLRNKVLRTPLFDTQRFAKNFSDALWSMWKEGRTAK